MARLHSENSIFSRWCRIFGGTVLFLLTFSPHSWALESACRQHFQQQQYIQAAKCFLKLYREVGQKKELREVQTLLKDRYLEQAAISYNRAADQNQDLAQRGFHKERAIKCLNLSIKHQHCQASGRCNRHTAWIAQITKEIQYVPIAIVTGNPNAQIQLKGYQYEIQERQRFSGELRPGNYTLKIVQPGQATREKTLVARPGHRIIINITPVQIKIVEKQIIVARTIPPLVLVGYIAGSALILTGAVLLVYGLTQQGELNAIRQDPLRNPAQTDANYHKDFDQAQLIGGLGALIAGVGGAVLLGGILAHVFSQKGPQTQGRITPTAHIPTRTLPHAQSTVLFGAFQ